MIKMAILLSTWQQTPCCCWRTVYLHSGAINSKAYETLATKYPIEE